MSEQPQELDPLLEALHSTNTAAQIAAAERLGNLGDPRAVAPLLAVLEVKQWQVRAAVMEALGKLGDKRAVEPLLPFLRYPEKTIRSVTALALGRLGDPRAVESLTQALDQENSEDVSAAIGSALEILGVPSEDVAALRTRYIKRERREILAGDAYPYIGGGLALTAVSVVIMLYSNFLTEVWAQAQRSPTFVPRLLQTMWAENQGVILFSCAFLVALLEFRY
jgi:hypothetical protein